MPVINSGDLAGFLPTQLLDGIVEKVKHGSTIAALSTGEPMKFGDANIITFDDDPTAEFVAEGDNKGSDTPTPTHVTASPRKAVVTYRTSDEFLWSNEDYQLGILEKLTEKGARAAARALDLGAYYRMNPRTGSTIGAWTNYLNSTSNRTEIASSGDLAEPDMCIEDAAGKVISSGGTPSGVALDPAFAWKLATARYDDGRKKFPELGLGIDVSMFEGLRASVSDTVSGRPEGADTHVTAIVGDFNQGIRWGIQRRMPFEVIQFGDPDGNGDLKRKNEVALRLEVVYAWYVFADRFAVVENATS